MAKEMKKFGKEKNGKGYAGREIPTGKGFTGMKEKDNTITVKMVDGMPGGDNADGQSVEENYDSGEGNDVGGNPGFGIHHAFENGIPNEGRENISAERMLPAHKENIDESVFDTIDDSKDDDDYCADISKIEPEFMGVHHTFGNG